MQKNQKTLLLLGGIRYLLPVIDAAHRLGIHVITADYLPENIAHKYSDEYCNVSIVDKEKVLEVAREKQIDGIMSFACDPGVVTAAYVAENLGLPFQGSYRATAILQDKGLFRAFLKENGFNVPNAKSYFDPDAPIADIGFFNWPVIVKPVDSAGSKGVSRVDDPAGLPQAIANALCYSISGNFIIEDFITISGYRSSADPFVVDGKLAYNFYSDQKFDKQAVNPFIPDKIIYPCTMSQTNQDYLTSELERLFHLLKMSTGIFNIEACVGTDGKPYIMEVSPRGGGNSIAEEQRMAYGVDLIENEVRKAVGLPLEDFAMSGCDGWWCNYAVHSNEARVGSFRSLWIDPEVRRKNVRYIGLSVSPGDEVRPFVGANDCIGDVFLRFDSQEQMDGMMSRVNDWMKVICD